MEENLLRPFEYNVNVPKYTDEIYQWLKQLETGDYNIHFWYDSCARYSVSFKNKNEAIMFKLTWG